MKKAVWSVAILILALIGAIFWLLRGADAKHLDRQEVIIDVPDTFEK